MWYVVWNVDGRVRYYDLVDSYDTQDPMRVGIPVDPPNEKMLIRSECNLIFAILQDVATMTACRRPCGWFLGLCRLVLREEVLLTFMSRK